MFASTWTILQSGNMSGSTSMYPPISSTSLYYLSLPQSYCFFPHERVRTVDSVQSTSVLRQPVFADGLHVSDEPRVDATRVLD